MTETISHPTPHLIHWSELSLREQVGQLVILHLSHDVGKSSDVRSFLERYPAGGVFGGGEVIEDGTNSFERVRAAVRQCQECARVPLLVAADLENGGGDVIPGLTPLPWPMALGAANDVDLAYRYGQATALEGALAGVNYALAPMADLNLHPLSSNVGTRAFGDEADRVLPLLKAFVRGLQDHGMAGCAKTFPGDGSDYRDQHVTTSMNQLNRADWERSYGRVFQEMIDDGVASIMTGHICAPALLPAGSGECQLPCTLSTELTSGLLKERMGFKGVVISDAFGMAGILSHGKRVEVAVKTFAAGADMLLWPGLGFMDRVVEEIENKRIPRSRLEDAMTRIWSLKQRYAGMPEDCGPHARSIAEAVSEQTAADSLTLLWNRSESILLRPDRHPRILLIGATPWEKAFDRFALLKEELEKRGFEVDLRRHVDPPLMEQINGDYDRVLIALERQFHRPLGPMEIFGDEARSVWGCNAHASGKLIAIGFGSPYLVPWYFSGALAGINAYSAVPSCQRAVAAALCGEAAFPGSSPVRIGNRFGITDLSAWN